MKIDLNTAERLVRRYTGIEPDAAEDKDALEAIVALIAYGRAGRDAEIKAASLIRRWRREERAEKQAAYSTSE